MLETPRRLAATGTDEAGYAVVAGRDADGRRVRVLISDFQSGYDGFNLRVENLPWGDEAEFAVTRRVLDGGHRLEAVEETAGRGRTLVLERPMSAPCVCVIDIAPKE